MKNVKFKNLIIIYNLITVICVTGLMLILISADILNRDNLFSPIFCIALVMIVILSIIISTEISNKAIKYFKKIEKNMKALLEGKIIDIKSIKNSSNIEEVNSFINTYISVIEIIKRNNFALNTEESKTEIILEHMADGVIAFSTREDVIHMNKSAMALLEINGELDTFSKIKNTFKLDINFKDIIYLPVNKCIQQKLEIGESVFDFVFVPFCNDGITPTGVILMIRNITESARLDEMRKEFVANVSHEFKTPLTSIKGYSETMMRTDLSKDEIEDFARVINKEANRMDRLVVDLLQLSKFDYSKGTLKKVNINLVELSKTVVEKMLFNAKQKEHKLSLQILNPVRIHADRDSIEQVLINIISNSIKYTPDGGNITVSIDCDSSKAIVKIKDDGLGIPKKDLDRIFERFYRVDKARSRQMGGTGLGLSIVKELIDSNNGTITMESELDRGTTTIITLPLEKNRLEQ